MLVAVGVSLVAAVAALYAVTLIAFENQSSATRTLEIQAPKSAYLLSALVTVTDLDPKLGLLRLRMDITPDRGLASDSGLATRYPLDIVAFGLTGRTELRIPAGQVPQELELSTGLFDGDVNKYPFDSYRSGFGLEAHALIGRRSVAVPFEMSVEPRFAGFRVHPSESAQSTPTGPFVAMAIRRSATTIGFAVFVMVMMWCLAIAALVIAVRFLLRRHRLELAFSGMSVGLLFAFPAVRNALPGVPPMGALIDYLSFFWAEALVAVALLTILLIFIRRGLPQRGAPDPADKHSAPAERDKPAAPGPG